VSPQHSGRSGSRTRNPAASSTATAAWPTRGVKCSVKVSTHSSTSWPPPACSESRHQARSVRGAKRGSGRAGAIPPSRRSAAPLGRPPVNRLASAGASEASRAHSGSQPSA